MGSRWLNGNHKNPRWDRLHSPRRSNTPAKIAAPIEVAGPPNGNKHARRGEQTQNLAKQN